MRDTQHHSQYQVNVGSSFALYVILPPLYEIMLQTLILVIGVDLLLLKTLFLTIV
jgi:hypothetical protein